MNHNKEILVDGKPVPVNGERNLLEVIRKADIDIPTFCYHSELSIYGACRMCTVEVEGRGLVASCSTLPEPGMVVHTNTEEIRKIRKMAVELILANHEQQCPTCAKNTDCKLQELAKRFGITKVRFRQVNKSQPVDDSSPVLVRDPNKCILCGDCVRMCAEVQGIGAIDFAFRGHDTAVIPAFGKNLDKVECVYCGQCARVCPTGAITPKSEVDAVWKAIYDPRKKVVAQIAPAVRVALGESFGLEPGEITTGKIVAVLKAIGFDQVYDTCFAADLTVIEEGNEFLQRIEENKSLPLFSSCCPAWVKCVEQYYPELLDNISSCRSPQQMFGSVAKAILPDTLKVKEEDLVVVSIMPCTAKKFEAGRPEFEHKGIRDVDNVLTTQELAQMVDEYGVKFNTLQPESLDLPLGFKTGAGVIFGATGGVTEAVLRYVTERVSGEKTESTDFVQVRGKKGVREATLELGGKTLKLAVVHGLANARKIAEKVIAGKSNYHFIEVMACPGGCIGGAGQPVSFDNRAREKRTEGLYEADKKLQVHKSQDNPYLKKLYDRHLGRVGGEKAHHLLHTGYQNRRRMSGAGLNLMRGNDKHVDISVCVGTGCYLRGSQDLLHLLVKYIEDSGLSSVVHVKATFCFEKCGQGPNVMIGDELISECSFQKARETLHEKMVEQMVGKSA